MKRIANPAFSFQRVCNGRPVRFTLKGREAWALSRLIEAGQKGVTPVSEPTGPRWSAYVFNLRHRGFDIETRHERHGGPFPGTHARYVLHDDVRPLGPDHGGADAQTA